MATATGSFTVAVTQGIHVWHRDLDHDQRLAHAGQFWFYDRLFYRCLRTHDAVEPPSVDSPNWFVTGLILQFASEGTGWSYLPRTDATQWRFRYGGDGQWSNAIPIKPERASNVHIWDADAPAGEQQARAGDFWFDVGVFWRCLSDTTARPNVRLEAWSIVGLVLEFASDETITDSTTWSLLPNARSTHWRLRYGGRGDWSVPIPIGGEGGGPGITPFASQPIGTWLKHVSSDPPTEGDFSVAGIDDDLRINKTDADGNDQSTVLEAIEVGQAITFGADEFTFVIETRQLNEPTYIEWTGYWADARADDNIEDTRVAIGHILHRVDMTGLLNERYRALPRELEEETEARESADDRLEDLTVDIHLQDSPGVFANVTDSTVAGIGLIENTSASRAALDARTFDFGSVTWMNPSADIPDDGNDYWVVVRVAVSLGHIETEFQLINDDSEEGTEHLRRSRQSDANWNYYQVSADTESVWTLQRRTS